MKTLWGDGIALASKSSADYSVTAEPLYLGRRGDVNPIVFHGDLEEIYVYHRALSGSEISELSSHGKIGLGGAALYYSMREVTSSSGLSGVGWKRCYRRAVNGGTGPTFHSLCDNKGPTISVIKTSSGRLFGGYTTQTWAGSGYSPDPDAFLFSLTYLFKNPPKDGTPYATYRTNSYGPTFGSGHDLYIPNAMSTVSVNGGNTYSCRPGKGTGSGVGSCGRDYVSVNGESVSDIEVYYRVSESGTFESSALVSSIHQEYLNYWVGGGRAPAVSGSVLDESGNGRDVLRSSSGSAVETDDQLCLEGTLDHR